MLAAGALLAIGQGSSAGTGASAAPGTAAAAQTSLSEALEAAATYYNEMNQSFYGLDPAALRATAAPGWGLHFVDGRTASSGPKTVSVHVTDQGTAVILAATGSKGGICWAIAEVEGPAVLDGVSADGPALYVELPKPPAGVCDAIELNRVGQVPGSSLDTWGGPPDARVSVQIALLTARTWYAQHDQTFDGLDPQTFETLDPQLHFVDGRTPSTASSSVSVHVTGSSGSAILLAASETDPPICWAIAGDNGTEELDGFTGPGTLYISYPSPATGVCDAIELNRVNQVPGTYTSPSGFVGLP